MALIAKSPLTASVSAITFRAAAASDTATCGGRNVLLVTNGSGASVDVTIAAQTNESYGPASPNKVVSVAAGATVGIMLSPVEYQNENGEAEVSYSATTDVDVAVIGV